MHTSRGSAFPGVLRVVVGIGIGVGVDVGDISCMSDVILDVEGRRGRCVGETIWWVGFGDDGRDLG